MLKIIKTRGVCLFSRKVRETSKLVTFYTENFGKLNFICKGARNPKSKYGAALEIFTQAEIIFNKSAPKPTYTLSDTNIINAFPNLKTTEKFFYANQIIELILKSTELEDPNLKLYHLLVSALKHLNSAKTKKKNNYMSLAGAFFLKAAALLGFKPQLRHCVLCKNPQVSSFSIDYGGVICNSAKHAQSSNTYGINHIKSMDYLLNKPLSKSLNFSIFKPTLDLIQNYLLFHLERVNLYSLKY
ncbi:MAG: DNA repair protein RecO [Candidatus Latescibacteria bacterium]|nr:DNA repair protein RecO [Candidatus Latescibacterota bacterium]